MLKKDVNGWPVEVGRYKVGNPKSCVAVCTLFGLDLIDKLASDKIAIVGKVVTENIGMEKIIKNIISNPNIRFLILCGQEPHGHWVGQAFQCIMDNGVGEDGRIIGARGAMPYLRNISRKEIETFKKQVKLVDLIDCEDVEKINKAIEECLANDPGAFDGSEFESETNVIYATHNESEFVQDEKGFFVININRDKQQIIAEHYTGEGKLHCKIVGKTAEEISATLVRLNLVSRLEHAAYLGRELQKAEIALQTGKEYEQEKELK